MKTRDTKHDRADSARPTASPPHSCLPGSGWSIVASLEDDYVPGVAEVAAHICHRSEDARMVAAVHEAALVITRSGKCTAIWRGRKASGGPAAEAESPVRTPHGLRWQDLDLDAGELRVAVTLQRVAGKLVLGQPKTDRSRRKVALPDVAVRSLRAHRKLQLQERLVAGSQWRDHGLVFTTTIGTPLDSRNVTKAFQELLSAAELPRLRFHDLRHTAATLLLAQNVHPRVVMEILGHSQIRLTMDTYSHVVPTLQREAADGMDALLTAPKS